MLRSFLSRNFNSLHGLFGSSRNVQAWRGLGHVSSTKNPSSPPRKHEAVNVFSPTVWTVPVADQRQSQQQEACPDTVSGLLSRLSLSPEEAAATVRYTLPSRSPVAQVAILDPVASVAIPWDCPTAVKENSLDVPCHQRIDVFIDEPSSSSTVTKRATNILQKRHRKMKRHQYKKWRKRNRFKLRTQKQRRRKKQQERWERHLNRFRFVELKPSEGEQYLAKKQEKLHLYLTYHGVEFDDGKADIKTDTDESKKKKKKGPSCVIPSSLQSSITPKPILPEGVQL
ncbi:uncharacterized protein LOC121427590 [Lytechinus variegatus]|uniref:uncharacterized protein LOC121427590 n=1 Tax=Lytechinus variegatus TaxID=7654 RepID=UPI001BB1272F|nr:uncharacterized protein LOC121427590 [Lytechinus variegatus]XP_041479993.1 uncharacterized protein LOC121427590 [Lytechinus variegatus]